MQVNTREPQGGKTNNLEDGHHKEEETTRGEGKPGSTAAETNGESQMTKTETKTQNEKQVTDVYKTKAEKEFR